MSNIVCIGGANLDILGACDQVFAVGDSNPGPIKYSAGGVARNIAENLQRLGNHCTLITALGNDLGKEKVLGSAQLVGLDLSATDTFDDYATGTYLAINNQLGSLMAAVSDMSIMELITPEYLQKRFELINTADYLVIDCNLPDATIAWIGQQSWRPKLVADAVSAAKASKLKPILKSIHILKVNRDEAVSLSGKPDGDKMLAKNLIDQGVREVLLSQGADGAIIANQEILLHLPAKRDINESDTGGGDALFAGFIAAQALLVNSEYQLEFALSCSSFTLASEQSVHPQISASAIIKKYLIHLPKSAWK